MKHLLAAIVCLTAGLAPAQAINLQQRDDGAPRVLHFDIERAHISNPLANDRARLARRSKTINAPLENEETLYFINGSLGTPPQDFLFHIDTGSSDMWVNVADSSLCKSNKNLCDPSGTYSANASSTYKYVNSLFNISYEDSSGAIGDYATDDFLLQGHNITDMQFGIGYESSSTQCLLGIGYKAIEAEAVQDLVKPYPNLPAKLAADGLIASNAYSLWLNDLQASTGSILFGGVDRAQYTGELRTVDVQKINGLYQEFLVSLTGLVLDGKTVAQNQDLSVLLDSGTTLTYLPNDAVESIYNSVDAVYDSNAGLALVDCSVGNSDAQIEYNFQNNITIKIGMNELVINTQDVTETGKRTNHDGLTSWGRMLRRSSLLDSLDGQAPCVFGIAPAGETQPVLGDTFLRSAYVVYDLDNNQISLAQSSFNATKNDVVEIGTGNNAVPQGAGEGESNESSASRLMAGSGSVMVWPVFAAVVVSSLSFAGLLL